MDTDIFIDSFEVNRLNPNSYNLRLDSKLLVYEDRTLDMKRPNHTREIVIPEDGLLLEPIRLYLGKTVEYSRTERLVPMQEDLQQVD